MIVADVNDEIGLERGEAFGDLAKRPLLRIVAGLKVGPLEPAAGVADHRDARRGVARQRDRRTVERGRSRRSRHP